jgi:hypothetical protein
MFESESSYRSLTVAALIRMVAALILKNRIYFYGQYNLVNKSVVRKY